jgi:hypothetical protein
MTYRGSLWVKRWAVGDQKDGTGQNQNFFGGGKTFLGLATYILSLTGLEVHRRQLEASALERATLFDGMSA